MPEYDLEGGLDYGLLLENLGDFLRALDPPLRAEDVLVVQASVHDIHLGTLGEYGAHAARLAAFLAALPCGVLFRSGDALHIPPGGRHIVERGLRDPRIRRANELARSPRAAPPHHHAATPPPPPAPGGLTRGAAERQWRLPGCASSTRTCPAPAARRSPSTATTTSTARPKRSMSPPPSTPAPPSCNAPLRSRRAPGAQ